MNGKGYVTVEIAVIGNKVVCRPERARCYWKTGPDNVRWVVPDPPPEVASVAIEFKNESPFQRICSEDSTVSSPVKDKVTAGNREQRGIFPYFVRAFDAAGRLVAEVDPDVENDPGP